MYGVLAQNGCECFRAVRMLGCEHQRRSPAATDYARCFSDWTRELSGFIWEMRRAAQVGIFRCRKRERGQHRDVVGFTDFDYLRHERVDLSIVYLFFIHSALLVHFL